MLAVRLPNMLSTVNSTSELLTLDNLPIPIGRRSCSAQDWVQRVALQAWHWAFTILMLECGESPPAAY